MSTKIPPNTHLMKAKQKLSDPSTDSEELKSILDELSAFVDRRVSYTELRNSGIGPIVGNLRKHQDGGVSNRADCLVSKWKSSVAMLNPCRNRAIHVIHEALGGGKSAREIACEIERLTYLDHGRETSPEYRARIRKLAYNLSCLGSDVLRADVVEGHISQRELCDMKDEDLAPEYIKERKAEEEKRAIAAAMKPKNTSEFTGMFVCPKCHGQRTETSELQTRHGDEGMTIFIHCVDCNKRWRR